MLTLVYNSRPQQSTVVAPSEFVTPERVQSLSVERLLCSPAPEETDGSPRAVREGIRARLRNLIHKVRKSLTLAQRRYKRNYDARVRPVNKDGSNLALEVRSISLLPISNWPEVASLTGQSPRIVGIGLWHVIWGVTSTLFIFYCLFACLSYLSVGIHYDRL